MVMHMLTEIKVNIVSFNIHYDHKCLWLMWKKKKKSQILTVQDFLVANQILEYLKNFAFLSTFDGQMREILMYDGSGFILGVLYFNSLSSWQLCYWNNWDCNDWNINSMPDILIIFIWRPDDSHLTKSVTQDQMVSSHCMKFYRFL